MSLPSLSCYGGMYLFACDHPGLRGRVVLSRGEIWRIHVAESMLFMYQWSYFVCLDVFERETTHL